MRKAFICHSSLDKHYVRVLAKKLGRAKVVFDEISFVPGKDFREQIIAGINSSCLFVFIASKASLSSLWCKFELEQAYFKKLTGTIETHLAIIIDRDVAFADLPTWMQQAKAVIQPRPSQATRDIQHSLFESLSPQVDRPFVGRQYLQESFTTIFSDLNTPAPHVFVVSGLEGIGRRSYLSRVVRDVLGLHLEPFMFVDEACGLDDIYLWALDETDDLGTRNDLANEMRAFATLGESQKIEEISNRLHLLCADNCVPCFVDQGGMLKDFGTYNDHYSELFKKFCSKHEDHYLACVHRRSPAGDDLFLHQRIGPLERHESRVLLQRLFRGTNNSFQGEKLNEISEFLDGYPPAAYFAATFAKTYGVESLLADKSMLVDFKARRFSRYINDLKLSDVECIVLKYLASEKPMPLAALAAAIGWTIEQTVPILRALIDNSLIVLIGENYGVSLPIRDAIYRAKGDIDSVIYKEILERLTKTFWNDPNAAPSLEIVDATLHAVARSGSTKFEPYQDLVRVSVVHRLAQECYHRKQWNQALEYAQRGELMDPQRKQLRAIHFKSFVQLERWPEAQAILDIIDKSGDRMTHYLRGFLLRKRKQYREAILAFQAALDTGDHSYAVYRDYADCLYRCKKYKEAFEKIQWVLQRDTENIHILDLIVRIGLDSSDFEMAERFLKELERFDLDQKFIHHRKARYLSAKKMWESALVEADVACKTGFSPFEAYAQRANIYIELAKYSEAAKEIDELQKKFRSHKRDIQIGLQCKLLIRQKKWREAKTVWDSMEDKSSEVHRWILYRILELKGRDEYVLLSERKAAAQEAEQLKSMLDHQENLLQLDLPEVME